MAAESGHHESYLDTLASTVLATALYWLAHAYAGLTGRRLSGGERLTPAALGWALAHDWAIVRGAAIPLLALLVAWAAGAALETAVTAALWSAVASVIALELGAAIRSRASGTELLFDLSVGVLMGVGIIALRALLHR
jgi:hypothetical protein